MELSRVRQILLDAGNEICDSMNLGTGVVTTADMVNALRDASQHWEESEELKEAAPFMLRLHMEMQGNRRYIMDILMEDDGTNLWSMRVSQVRKQAMSQSIWKLLTTIYDNDDWLLLTTAAVSNGAIMESLMPFFQDYPSAAREWGLMIRAILVLLWGLTCDEEWDSVTGEEALELWEGVTREVNMVLPPQARLHARYSYAYSVHT
jgi:hypothetical protein